MPEIGDYRRSGGLVGVAGGLRRSVGVGVLVVGLVACTSSDHPHASPTTGSSNASLSLGVPSLGSSGTKSLSPFCAKLSAAGQRIQQAQVKLYTSSGGDSAAVNALVTELDGLKDGAPAAIKAALGDLASAFQDAQTLLAHPSSADSTQLATIGSKLASDARQISSYVTSKC